MRSRYYQPGTQRAQQVHRLFSQIARRYDLINDLQSFGLHRSWKHRLVRLADPSPGRRALDICCGTGDVSFLLAEAGCEVVGLDFTESMLERARMRETRKRRLRKAGVRCVHWLLADAQHLPFADASFDVVTVSYGLRNLSDWQLGLREMWRVCRPGGRMLALDFGKPDHPVWRAIYFGYLRVMVPWFGRIFCGDAEAYAYILDSLRDYPAQRGLQAIWQQWGAERAETFNLLGGIMSINRAIRPPHAPLVEEASIVCAAPRANRRPHA